MARYQLPAPQSMYRDTGLVANTELFRKRYIENMAADDQLAQAILGMESMEEDNEAKRTLIEKYNAQLEQRTQSGNYHTIRIEILLKTIDLYNLVNKDMMNG